VRALIFIPVAVLLLCVSGYGCCAALGWDPHPREMFIAATTCLAAGLLAVVPLALARYMTGALTPASAAQAALVGTMIHLFICIGVAAVVLLTKMHVATAAFTYWLLALYWTTLAALAAALVAEVRAVAAAAGSPGQPQQQ
jgi:hypothetical protein